MKANDPRQRHRDGVSLAISCVATLLACWPATPAQADDGAFEQIIPPGADVRFTSVTGINARGDIVGQLQDSTGTHGFRLDRHGDFSAIDHPEAIATNAFDISSSGTISGDFRLTPNGPIHGFVLNQVQWTRVDCGPTLGAVHTFALAINSSGTIAGEIEFTPAPQLGVPGRAVIVENGVCMDVTPPEAGASPIAAVAWAINEAGEVAGFYRSPGDGSFHGWVRYRDGTYETIDYPGAVFTNVRGLNTAGDLVGVFRVAGGANQGFVMTADGDFRSIGYPAASVNRALGVNERGDIIGDYSGADCPIARCGWVWRKD